MKLKVLDVYKDESSYAGVIEPVTLAEAKAWILVDYPDDDLLITSLITQSRHSIEDFCNISIVPKSIYLTARFDGITQVNGYISRWDRKFYGVSDQSEWAELPYGPVSSVQSVTSTQWNNITILTANTDYYLTGKGFQQIRITGECDTILIQYSTPYYCPSALKEAILAEIAFGYENRGSGLNRYAAQNVGVSERAQALARPYKRTWL